MLKYKKDFCLLKFLKIVSLFTLVSLWGSCSQSFYLSELIDGPNGIALSISPATVQLVNGKSITFEISGGAPPYTLELGEPLTGTGELISDLSYTAPSDLTGIAKVQVTDSYGGKISARIDVVAASEPTPVETLLLNPAVLSISTGNTISLVPSGGLPPYFYVLTTPIGGNGENLTGSTYTAPSDTAGTAVITVIDSNFETSTSSITVSLSAGGGDVNNDVDYRIDVISHLNPSYNINTNTNETFSFSNQGSESGTFRAYWTAYISHDQILNGTDTVISSGSIEGLDPLETSGPISIHGTWPSTAGIYYLILRVSSADDSDPSNDFTASNAFTINNTAAVVDYALGNLTKKYPTIPSGSLCSETFTISNIGGSDGTEEIRWTAYASSDMFPGGDTPIGSGTLEPLNSSDNHVAVPITSGDYSGSWPAAAGSYYLIVEFETDTEDTSLDNNVTVAGVFNVINPPDYSVFSMNIPPVEAASGATLSDYGSYEFVIKENANAGGNQPIGWEVYASIDTILDGGDEPILSGNLAALDEGESETINFSNGNWPEMGAYYYIIINIHSGDDSNSANNRRVSSEPVSVPTIFTEEPEPYNNNSSWPPSSNTSDLAAALTNGELEKNELIKIKGIIDPKSGNDTYEFTLAPTVTSIELMADWISSNIDNAIDLELWSGTDPDWVWVWSSIDNGGLTEPSAGIPDVISDKIIGGDTYYLKVTFNNNDAVGDDYSVRIWGKP